MRACERMVAEARQEQRRGGGAQPLRTRGACRTACWRTERALGVVIAATFCFSFASGLLPPVPLASVHRSSMLRLERGLAVSGDRSILGEPSLGRRLGGGLAMKTSNEAGGDDSGIQRAGDGALSRSSSKRARMYAKIERFFNKMEARAEKLEEKVSKKLAKRGDKLALLGYKRVWIIATVACLAAVPVAGGALSVLFYSFQIFWLFLKMSFILMAPAGMFLGSGAALAFPAVLPTISSFLSVATFVTAMLLFFAPRARSLLSLSLGSLLPLLSGWVAMMPARTVEVIESVRIFDPLRPLIEEEFFRPLFADLFMSDFLAVVPKPFLVAGPVEVVVSSSVPSPFLALKLALSVAAVGVAAYAWYSERDRVKAWLSPGPALSLPPPPRERLPMAQEEEEGHEEAGRLAALKAWEEEYQLRPPPSSDPAEWSQEELSVQLSIAGLQGCVEPLRRARIDGRVALTLTWSDEEEMREELGLSKLGERRRLLLFVEDMRAAHERERRQRAEEGGGAAEPGGAS